MRSGGLMRAVLAGVLLLCGCVTSVQTRVERFDSLPGQTAGKAIHFFPSREQETSAEFSAYVRSLAGRLAGLGFREAPDLPGADYAIFLNYGVAGSRTVATQTPVYGQTGGGATWQSGSATVYGSGGPVTGTYAASGYSTPSYGVVGMIPGSTTQHARYLVFKMIDVKASNGDKLVAAYEGQVSSEGTAGSFAAVSECMFEALFRDFRRTGGQSIQLDGACIRQ